VYSAVPATIGHENSCLSDQSYSTHTKTAALNPQNGDRKPEKAAEHRAPAIDTNGTGANQGGGKGNNIGEKEQKKYKSEL